MHSVVKRKSTYYFRQRIPKDVRRHFPCAEIIHSLHTGLYRQAKSLAIGELRELEKVFMTIRAGVLTEVEIEKLVDKYKREQLSKSEALMDTLLTVDGGSVKSARKTLLEYHKEQTGIAKDVLLDLRGLEEMTVHTAQSLLGITREDGDDVVGGINIDSYGAEFKNLCRAVALANKEIFETLVERNESGDSEYDRKERAKPKCKTLQELIAQYEQV